MATQFADMVSLSKLFDVAVFLLSKFHANVITASEVMTIFVYKGLAKIRKSQKPPSDFCPILGD